MALSRLAQGKVPEALSDAQESLELRKRIGDVVGQARSHTVIGMILQRLERFGEAVEHLRQALALEQLQNPRGQGIALLHLGETARSLRKSEPQTGFCARLGGDQAR